MTARGLRRATSGSGARARPAALLSLVAALLVATALGAGGGCGTDAPPTPPDSGPDAGPDAGPAASWSTPVTIEPGVVPASGLQIASDLVAAVDPQGRPAIAWFGAATDAGTYPLNYAVETAPGTWSKEVVPASATSGNVAGHYGVAIAYDGQGSPLLAYVGGQPANSKAGSDGRWTNFDTGQALPSDSIVARKSGGTWTRFTLGNSSSAYVSDGIAVDDQGGIVGLWSAIAVDSAGTVHVAQRDVHFASDNSAFENSNLEYGQFTLSGSAATKAVGEMVASLRFGTPLITGPGNYSRMVLAGGQPALSFVLGTDSTSEAKEVWFARRSATGWSKKQVSIATGLAANPPALVYSATAGASGGAVFGIAFLDQAQGDLRLATSADGSAWDDEPVETLGVTGLHPAAAFGGSDGKTLGLLYAYCRAPIDPATQCNAATQEIRFRGGPSTNLFDAAVERVAGVMPDSAALVADGQGKFVAIWRDPALGIRASRRTP